MSTQIDLGPVLSIPKGDWNADTTYERLNMVRHNSAAWICNVATSKGVEPTEDSTDWYLQVKDTSSVTSVNGMKGDVVIELTETETPPANDNSNRIATTEWVTDKLGDVDLSGIKDDTVLAAQLASNLEVSKDTLSYAELIDYIARVERNTGMPMGVPIPYTGKDVPAGFLRADGATYTSMQGAFPEFYEWVVNSGLTVPLADYTLVEDSCGYYGLDTSTGTVRMPTLAAGVFGAVTADKYGQAVQAGLPNIKGDISYVGTGLSTVEPELSGAFSRNGGSYSGGAKGGDIYRIAGLHFRASDSSAIYRDDIDTVTPSHVKYPWIISVYNAAVSPSVAQAGEFVEMLDRKVDKLDPKDSTGKSFARTVNGIEADAEGEVSDVSAIVGASNAGYIRFTNGLQLCWGGVSVPANKSSLEVTFPAAFIGSYPRITLAHTYTSMVFSSTYPISNTSFTLNAKYHDSGTNTTRTMTWIAVGYWK